MGILCGRAAVFLDALLDLGVWDGQDLAHRALKPLPRFRAFHVFRLRLHGLIIPLYWYHAQWTNRMAAYTMPRNTPRAHSHAAQEKSIFLCGMDGASCICPTRSKLHARHFLSLDHNGPPQIGHFPPNSRCGLRLKITAPSSPSLLSYPPYRFGRVLRAGRVNLPHPRLCPLEREVDLLSL
jgi:hypothetical protein